MVWQALLSRLGRLWPARYRPVGTSKAKARPWAKMWSPWGEIRSPGPRFREGWTEKDFLLEQRIVMLRGMITHDLAVEVIMQLLYLQHEDAQGPLTLRIESHGGEFPTGLAIVDAMRALSPPIHTEATIANGMAAVILAAGRKGQRVISPDTFISLVPLRSGDAAAPASDLERAQHALAEVIAELSGQPLEVVSNDLSAGRYLTADQAIEYGLADRIGI